MKLHNVLLLISASALLLMACSNESEPEVTEDADADTEEVVDETTETEVDEPIEDSLEIDPMQPLENIGEFKYTQTDRVELLNIIRPSETYTITEGVNLKFNDIKIMYHSEIPDSEKEFFRNFYGFDDQGYSIQFSYSVNNNLDETIGGIEILDIVTSNGNQYNLYNDGFSIDGSAYEVRPNATTNVGVTFSITNSEIEYLDLYFEPFDSDGYGLGETSINLIF